MILPASFWKTWKVRSPSHRVATDSFSYAAVPKGQTGFRHAEGDSDAHVKASLVGPSVTVLVDDGELLLGRWQGIFFCEFDGPRSRSVHVKWLGK